MNKRLRKAIEPKTTRHFGLRGNATDETTWHWEVNPPPVAFWDDGVYVQIEEYNQLLRVIELLVQQRDRFLEENYWLDTEKLDAELIAALEGKP